jgi:hypothetical protein
MKRLIIAILLISSVVALASQPFVLEPIVPKKYQMTWDQEQNEYIEIPIADYLQIQRNFDKIARKIREGEYQADSNFVQKGTLTQSDFDFSGGVYEAVVYLPEKYVSTSTYRVYISRQAPAANAGMANQTVGIMTDSSFIVKSDTTGNGIYWLSIGIRKK